MKKNTLYIGVRTLHTSEATLIQTFGQCSGSQDLSVYKQSNGRSGKTQNMLTHFKERRRRKRMASVRQRQMRRLRALAQWWPLESR